MRRLTLLAAGLALLPLAAATAQTAQPAAQAQAPASAFSADAFRAHVTFLADDLLEGREAGTRGHELAARYVATQFAGLGLRPGNGESWYQPVTLGRATPAADARLTIGSQSFSVGETFIFRPSYQGAPVAEEAEAVFVGYGIDAPSNGFDDYRGLDVRGKIVVVLGGLPEGIPSDVAAHLGAARQQMAAARGAIGMIQLRGADAAARAPLARAGAFASRPSTTWLNQDGRPGAPHEQLRFHLIADAPVAEALFSGARRTWRQISADVAANRRPAGFALRPRVGAERGVTVETFTSPNVVAVIPGSDPALANEYVLLMAHLDGVGLVPEGGDHNPNQSAAGSEDRIRNGAMDNATGIATLIEVARHFMEPGNRPRRPILLAAVTAEEKGLLGASYLAANPVTPGRIVGLVNLDMPILTYDFQDVIAFGAEHSEMGPMVDRAASAMGVQLSADPLPEQGLFTRSDHYPFVQQGIPAVFLMTGFANGGEERFRGFLGDQYHSVRDDLNLPFNWQAGARFAELNFRITQELANAPQAPRWYRGSFFGDTLAGDQPRAPRPAAAAAAPAAR